MNMKACRKVLECVVFASVAHKSDAKTIAAVENTASVRVSSCFEGRKSVGHIESPRAKSKAPKRSFSPARRRLLSVLRGGGADSGSNPYSPHRFAGVLPPWRNSNKRVRLVNTRRDGEAMCFGRRSTRAEEPETAYIEGVENPHGPTLPSYPEEFPYDNSTSPFDLPPEGTTPMHPFVGEGFGEEQNQEIVAEQYTSHQDGVNRKDHKETLPHSPIVYRFFGRSRVRTHRSDFYPFILLGPSVDHWKSVGLLLASRGFDVMACERLEDHSEDSDSITEALNPNDDSEEDENMIVSVLDTLRWNHAILVGCDSEAERAIKAALRLSPDRVAGLVLCGELSSASELVTHLTSSDSEYHDSSKVNDPFSIDSYLQNHLDCPFEVIWDGNIRPLQLKGTQIAHGQKSGINRCLIIGGGTAPHRRLPEQFAWVLTRFVEEQVAPRMSPPSSKRFSDDKEHHGSRNGNKETSSDRRSRIPIPSSLNELFSPSTFLVVGRVMAAAIFYATALKVAVFQYENVRSGMENLNAGYKTLSSRRKHVLQSVFMFLQNCTSLVRIFKVPRSMVGDETEILGKETEPELGDEDDLSEQESEPLRQVDYLDRIVV